MPKAKSPAQTRKPRDNSGKMPGGTVPGGKEAVARTAMVEDRPPESAEDFAHVLRRLAAARSERAAGR